MSAGAGFRIQAGAMAATAAVPAAVQLQALDTDERVIGHACLAGNGHITQLQVAGDCQRRGVGQALLQALTEQVLARGGDDLQLLAPLPARDFFARHGFLPAGAEVADGDHRWQPMRRRLRGAVRVHDLAGAVAMTASIAQRARRQLLMQLHTPESGVLDNPLVLRSLRRFACARHDKQLLIVVHDSATLQQHAPALLELAQRLPSVIHIRQPQDPIDRQRSSACIVNDLGDYYFRLIGQRMDGEAAFDQPARARQLREDVQQIWARSRDCSELRSLRI